MQALLSLLLVLALAGCTGVPKGIQPVSGFELERYLGTWHEVARLDHRFERGLSDVTAKYSRRDDGGIDVLNRGYDASRKQWREARGRAYFTQSANLGSLKVSFFGPFYGGYHVFALDPDYQWAMIAGPSRDYLWILARQPALPQETLARLIGTAREAGFDTDALIFPAARTDASAVSRYPFTFLFLSTGDFA
jgi:apolipoprotein D and lipocalin family protein